VAYIIKTPEGEEAKHNGETVYGSDFVGAIKSVNLDKRELVIIGTTEAKDRDGDVVKVRGWELGPYLKNPVFLWAHDHSSVPIGAATKVVRKKAPQPHLLFNIRFPSNAGVYPFADMILDLFEDDIIRASSVGFLPKQWEDLQEDKNDTPSRPYPGRLYTSQELLELSGCAVPSNPEALSAALGGSKWCKTWDNEKRGRFAEFMLLGRSIEPEEKEIAMEVVDNTVRKGVEFVDEYEPTKVFMPGEKQEQVPEVTTEEVPETGEEKNVTMTEDELADLIELVKTNTIVEFTEGLNALAEQPVEASAEEAEKTDEDTKSINIVLRAGQVLNAKNKSRLKNAMSLIREVIESAEPPEQTGEEGDKQEMENNEQYWEEVLAKDADPKEESKEPPVEHAETTAEEPVSEDKGQTEAANSGEDLTEQDMRDLSNLIREELKD